MEQTRTDRVPVTLLVGFLGSGKTTMANRLLSEQHDERMAVIVNEFGDVGIDGSLIVNVKDNVIELSNGCLCCTVQDDLAATLHALLKRRRDAVVEKPFGRILIEASGLASPGPAVQTVLVDPMLVTQLRLDGVITLVHGKHIVQQLQEHPEAADQVAYADRVILNHCDQCDATEIDAAEAAILACNHYAEITQTTLARVEIASLLDIRTWDTLDPRLERPRSAQSHDHADQHQTQHVHTSDVGTLTLRSTAPLDLKRLRVWLVFLTKRREHDLMRLKGILHCQQHDEAVIVQGVYKWVALHKGASRAPDESVLVLIGRHLNAEEISREWRQCWMPA
jgi:G3E family GTPase